MSLLIDGPTARWWAAEAISMTSPTAVRAAWRGDEPERGETERIAG